MASILDRYGIKEVADVTFYEITNEGKRGKPVLYLDTLKVSTIEQTAEQAEARGGKGNPPLIIWDYGKEINVTLEDALFSAKSMAIMFGNGTVDETVTTVTKTVNKAQVDETTKKVAIGKHTVTLTGTSGSNEIWYKADGTKASGYADGDFVCFGLTATTMGTIDISANSFPGTYYVTGDTYARSEITGEDEFFQFVIQKAKVQSENTITLEAEGDPSVFNMSLRVLRPSNGKMMQLVKYDFGESENLTLAAPDINGDEDDYDVVLTAGDDAVEVAIENVTNASATSPSAPFSVGTVSDNKVELTGNSEGTGYVVCVNSDGEVLKILSVKVNAAAG